LRWYERVENVNVLLAVGANPNTAATLGDGEKHTPLIFAVACGKVGVVEALLDWGAMVNAASDDKGETPLMAACEPSWCEKSLVAVRLLLARGANVHAADKAGRTALHCATEPPPAWVTKADADADAAAAAAAARAAVVRALLAAGADARARDAAGRAPADGAPPALAALLA